MDVLLDTCAWRMVKSLLLLYIFVVRAAADCPKPQGKKHMVLTDEALLKNDFPEGSEATLECANGYTRKDGSGIITCTGSQWTEPDLNCTKKDCGPPTKLPHMSFDTDKGTLFGATARVRCDKGYIIVGTSYKQCFPAGWYGSSRCEVATCAKPDEVTNGRHSWDSQADPVYSDIIQYFCNEGYALTGNNSIVCSENEEYNSLPPECKVVTCAKPDEITNGRHSWDSQEDPVYSDVIQYFCNEGYALTGNNSIECSKNGEYNSLPPECKGGKNILTTEDTITTTGVTSATPPPVRGGTEILKTVDIEASTTTAVSPTIHTDKIITTSATSTASPPTRGKRGDVDTNSTNTGYAAVIASVISTAIVVPMVVFILYCFLLKKKGSSNGTVLIC